VVYYDVGCHVGFGTDAFVLLYFAFGDGHILLDVGDDYSFGIHVADGSLLDVAHDDIEVVDGILGGHGFFYD
jgi:hypothetical protein